MDNAMMEQEWIMPSKISSSQWNDPGPPNKDYSELIAVPKYDGDGLPQFGLAAATISPLIPFNTSEPLENFCSQTGSTL